MTHLDSQLFSASWVNSLPFSIPCVAKLDPGSNSSFKRNGLDPQRVWRWPKDCRYAGFSQECRFFTSTLNFNPREPRISEVRGFGQECEILLPSKPPSPFLLSHKGISSLISVTSNKITICNFFQIL